MAGKAEKEGKEKCELKKLIARINPAMSKEKDSLFIHP